MSAISYPPYNKAQTTEGREVKTDLELLHEQATHIVWRLEELQEMLRVLQLSIAGFSGLSNRAASDPASEASLSESIESAEATPAGQQGSVVESPSAESAGVETARQEEAKP